MPNPIHKVLSTLKEHQVKSLLMGGQACVFYGAAEFSRDTDVALLASQENLDRLALAMKALDAEVIAVPPLRIDYLKKGHAVHFRCRHPDAAGMRLDVMSVMRGLPNFSILWERRTTACITAEEIIEIMALPDLVKAKKTQRDKDWPMIRRLVESHYIQFAENPSAEIVEFWLAELRTPALLLEVAGKFPDALHRVAGQRPFLSGLSKFTTKEVEQALAAEEDTERTADKAYWLPLRKELEQLRHKHFQ